MELQDPRPAPGFSSGSVKGKAAVLTLRPGPWFQPAPQTPPPCAGLAQTERHSRENHTDSATIAEHRMSLYYGSLPVCHTPVNVTQGERLVRTRGNDQSANEFVFSAHTNSDSVGHLCSVS